MNIGENIKIAIIVPTYKVEKYLREALDSILNQTYSNWEAICIDDGSPDGSGAILDEYARKDKRFRIIHQKNGGVSIARNTGLNALSPTSTHVTFLDPDDVLDYQLFETLVVSITKYQPDVISFLFRYVSTNFVIENTDVKSKNLQDIKTVVVEGQRECFYYVWSRSAFISTGACGKLWSVNAIQNVRFIEGIKTGEDSMFNWMASYNYKKITSIDYQGYYYRANPTSILHSKHMLAALKGWHMRTKVIAQFYKQNNERFYCWLPLFAFVKHLLLIILCKLRILKTANFEKLSFSIEDKHWNLWLLLLNGWFYFNVRCTLATVLFFAKIFKIK